MSERLKSKLCYFLSLTIMISILLGVTYLGFMQKLDIDIMKNMELVYSGENGNATLRVRNSSKVIDQRVDALIVTVKYQASPNSGLSNGDTVHIVASYDKEVAKQYKFRIKETSKDITVEGLPSQYPNLAAINTDYLEAIEDAANDYIQDHRTSIYQVEVDENEKHPHLNEKTVMYKAFMKSKESGISDRVLEIVRLNYENVTLYYMVIVPDINDSNEVVKQDVYGQKATMTNEEIENQSFKEYVARIFGDKYTIEDMANKEADASK